MRLLVLASGEFAIPTLRSVRDRRQHEIACVVTQPDRPAGRGRHAVPTPVKTWALDAGIAVIEGADVNEPAMVQRIRDQSADLGLVIAFGQKLSPALIDAFPHGCVNLHASLLPKFRGAAPYQWAILSGEKETGVTVFRLTSRMDGGPVLSRRSTAIRSDETAEELHDRLARIGPDAVTAALAQFAGGNRPAGTPQGEGGASRAPKLTKRDGQITFAAPARQVVNQILGSWSWPGAACLFVAADGKRRERVTLARARLSVVPSEAHDPGRIDERLYVSAADGWIELLELQPEGGRVMTWQEFVNGRHVRAGDRFETLPDAVAPAQASTTCP
jgi:methionyl-tRNA formyltransferase